MLCGRSAPIKVPHCPFTMQIAGYQVQASIKQSELISSNLFLPVLCSRCPNECNVSYINHCRGATNNNFKIAMRPHCNSSRRWSHTQIFCRMNIAVVSVVVWFNCTRFEFHAGFGGSCCNTGYFIQTLAYCSIQKLKIPNCFCFECE